MELNKIYNMDCLEGLKMLPDKSIDLILTDPPYGINYQSAWRIDSERFEHLEGDGIVNTDFLADAYRILKEDSAAYIFTRWDVYPEWLKAVKGVGFIVKNLIVWDRVIHGLGDLNGSYAPTYDQIIFAVKGKHSLLNGRPKDIIRIKRVDADKMQHPTQKPVELIKYFIKHSTNEEDTIIDPFMGSGSTAVACKALNRNFIGFEINPDYCKIAEKRLQQETLSSISKLNGGVCGGNSSPG